MESSTRSEQTPATRSWGVVQPAWQWIISVLVGPPVLGLLSAIGGGIIGVLCSLPISALMDDPRMADTIWVRLFALNTGACFALFFMLGGGLTALMLLAWWAGRMLTTVRLDQRALVSWTLAGRRTIPWDAVSRAFVTRQPGNGERTLHLWTAWREVALPATRLVDEVSQELQDQAFEVFLGEVRGHLEGRGLALEEEVPVSLITDTTWPLRHLLFWPHRRVLARQHMKLRADQPPVDHRQSVPSLHLAWMFKPATQLCATVTLGALAFAHMGTEHPRALALVSGVGLLLLVAIPLWNVARDGMRRLERDPRRGALTPEMLVGRHEVPETLPPVLLPAHGCYIDLKNKRVGRPDGRVFKFEDVAMVDYGPPRRGNEAPRDPRARVEQEAWHLALALRSEQGGPPREIFHNASADVVRHGDLDAGYAVFNWIAARTIALEAGADLVLAQGRVAASRVGRPLREQLARELVRYEPEALEAQVEHGRAGLRLAISEDSFQAWGPLVRLPEAVAAPPIWKALLGVALLALIPTGLTPAGLLAGWLLAASIHDAVASMHFARPGFRMDEDGVWVRGACMGWEQLEQSTLMPVAPGPILFAGARALLVAGHLGGTYAERAWMGCAAYRWIQDRARQGDHQAL